MHNTGKILIIIMLISLLIIIFPGIVLADYQEYLASQRLQNVFFSKNGEKMITITDRSVATWRIDNGRPVRVGLIDEVTEEKEIFSGKYAHYFNGRNGAYAGENYNLTISPDGSLWAYNNPPGRKEQNLVVVSKFEEGYDYETALKSETITLYPLPNYHTDIWLAISPDNSEIAGYYKTKNRDNEDEYYLYIWSLDNGEIIESARLPNLKSPVQKIDYNYFHHFNENRRYGFIEYSPDGKYIVVGGARLIKKPLEPSGYFWLKDQLVKLVIDRETLEYNKMLNTPKIPSNVIFSSDSKLAFVRYGKFQNDFRVFDLDQMKEVGKLNKIYGQWDAVSAGNGLYGAVRWEDFEEYLFEENKLKTMKKEVIGERNIFDIAYNSREGKWLIAASDELHTIEATTESYLKAEAELKEAKKLMGIGFYEEGIKKFKSAIKLEPLKVEALRKSRIYFEDLKAIPLQYRGEILAYYYHELRRNDQGVNNFIWSVWRLIDYGILASYSGHPALTRQAILNLKNSKGKYDGKLDDRFIKEGITLLEALVIAVKEGSNQAYKYLLNQPRLDQYVDYYLLKHPGYLAPLYQDRKKLAYFLGREESELPQPEIEEIQKVSFVDLEGNVIEPLADVPLIKEESEEEGKKDEQGSSERQGTVLD